ncbi:hypothetical protein BDP27DRAFT_1373563 [Rhodocollybia butyracea]|uniref:DNA 3'-5' helicase n=1 Tax=Rhodocollybia butyracea TaxID=206335 RepID=A0A9P5P5T0_9AGAR|nr:hypothetical protein BDP27DRAFT_1373563 [Rhodocollybia butyracea]
MCGGGKALVHTKTHSKQINAYDRVIPQRCAVIAAVAVWDSSGFSPPMWKMAQNDNQAFLPFYDVTILAPTVRFAATTEEHNGGAHLVLSYGGVSMSDKGRGENLGRSATTAPASEVEFSADLYGAHSKENVEEVLVESADVLISYMKRRNVADSNLLASDDPAVYSIFCCARGNPQLTSYGFKPLISTGENDLVSERSKKMSSYVRQPRAPQMDAERSRYSALRWENSSLREELERNEGLISLLEFEGGERKAKHRAFLNAGQSGTAVVQSLKKKNGHIDHTKNAFERDEVLKDTMRKVFDVTDFRLCLRGSVCSSNTGGRDVVVVMPTGGVEPLAYQLPAVFTPGDTLAISPLMPLISDQIMHAQDPGVEVVKLTGRPSNGGKDIKLLRCTPKKVAKSKRFASLLQKFADADRLTRVVINEAHCTSQLGYNFRSGYQKLHVLQQLFPNVPITALSAMCPPLILQESNRCERPAIKAAPQRAKMQAFPPAPAGSCWLAAGLDDVQTWLSQSNKFSGNQDVPKPLVGLVNACVLEKWARDQSQSAGSQELGSTVWSFDAGDLLTAFPSQLHLDQIRRSESSSAVAPAQKKPKISNSHSQGSRKNANGKDKCQGDEPVGNLQAYVRTFDASAEGAASISVPQGFHAHMLSFAARPGLNEQEEAYLRQIENSSRSSGYFVLQLFDDFCSTSFPRPKDSRRDGPRTATDDEMQDQDEGGSEGEGDSDVTMEDDEAGYVVVEDAMKQKGKKKNWDGESAGRGKVLESDIASSALAKISKQASRMGICLLDMFPDNKMFAWEILEKELVRQKENSDDAVLEDLIKTQKDPQKVEDLLAWMKYGESDVCYALAQAARILVNQYFELGSVAEGGPREKKITGQPFYSLLIPQTLCAFLLDDRWSKADLLLVAELHELKRVPARLIAMVTATVFVLIYHCIAEHAVASLEGIHPHSPAYFDFLEKQAYKNMKTSAWRSAVPQTFNYAALSAFAQEEEEREDAKKNDTKKKELKKKEEEPKKAAKGVEEKKLAKMPKKAEGERIVKKKREGNKKKEEEGKAAEKRSGEEKRDVEQKKKAEKEKPARKVSNSEKGRGKGSDAGSSSNDGGEESSKESECSGEGADEGSSSDDREELKEGPSSGDRASSDERSNGNKGANSDKGPSSDKGSNSERFEEGLHGGGEGPSSSRDRRTYAGSTSDKKPLSAYKAVFNSSGAEEAGYWSKAEAEAAGSDVPPQFVELDDDGDEVAADKSASKKGNARGRGARKGVKPKARTDSTTRVTPGGRMLRSRAQPGNDNQCQFIKPQWFCLSSALVYPSYPGEAWAPLDGAGTTREHQLVATNCPERILKEVQRRSLTAPGVSMVSQEIEELEDWAHIFRKPRDHRAPRLPGAPGDTLGRFGSSLAKKCFSGYLDS